MSTGRQHNPAAQIVVGVAVILIGLMFLLDNLGWLDFDMSAQFWPVILIVAGILKIMQSRSTNATIVGERNCRQRDLIVSRFPEKRIQVEFAPFGGDEDAGIDQRSHSGNSAG